MELCVLGQVVSVDNLSALKMGKGLHFTPFDTNKLDYFDFLMWTLDGYNLGVPLL